jgi:hypothetical protein
MLRVERLGRLESNRRDRANLGSWPAAGRQKLKYKSKAKEMGLIQDRTGELDIAFITGDL